MTTNWFRAPVIAVLTLVLSFLIVAPLRTILKRIWRAFCACDVYKRCCIVFILVLFLRTLIFTLCQCGLYGDGSAYFLSLLSSRQLDLWNPPRKGGILLSKLLPYLLMRIGIQNFKMLSYAFTLSCVLWVTLWVSAAVYLCYRNHDERLLCSTVILWSLILSLAGLYCIHESLAAAAAMWFVFSCIHNWDYVGHRISWLALFYATLIFSLLGLYESVAFFGPAILLYAFLVWRRTRPIHLPLYLGGIVLLLANTAYSVYYVVHPTMPELKNGFITQLLHQPPVILALLICIAILMFAAEFCGKKERYAKLLRVAEIMLSEIVLLCIVCNLDKIAQACMIFRTILNVALPFAFLVYESLLLFIPGRKAITMHILPLALGASCLVSAFGVGTGYYNYLKHLHDLTQSSHGFVAWDISDPYDSYNTDWPVPYESVTTSALFSPGEPLQSILVEEKERIYYQNFNIWDITQYPDLTAYGIAYDKAAFDPTVRLQNGELAHISCMGEAWNANEYISQGISHNENFFTWTNGGELLFYPIQITDYDDVPLSLTLSVVGTYNGTQRLVAYCNEQKITETEVPKDGGQIVIPIHADENGKLQICIELPDAISPDTVEHTGDTRQLALMLTEMSIKVGK